MLLKRMNGSNAQKTNNYFLCEISFRGFEQSSLGFWKCKKIK